MSICTAKYIWTSDDYVVAMGRHYSLALRFAYKMLLKVASALLLALVIFITIVAVVSPDGKRAPYWAFALVATICVYGLVYDRVNVWYWKRKFRKSPPAKGIEWTFEDDFVQMKASLGEATLKWEAFIKVVEFPDGFMFYSTKNFFFWIPFSSLESVLCIETVRAMIINSKCPYTQQK